MTKRIVGCIDNSKTSPCLINIELKDNNSSTVGNMFDSMWSLIDKIDNTVPHTYGAFEKANFDKICEKKLPGATSFDNFLYCCNPES